jgi:MFS family permease
LQAAESLHHMNVGPLKLIRSSSSHKQRAYRSGVSEAVGALREPPFRAQFLAQATSMVGDQIAPVALAFAVIGLTGSAKDLGVVLAARLIPMLVFLLAGGVWADRFDRRGMMVLSDTIRCASQGVLALLLLVGHAQIWHLVLLQALHGIGTGLFRPASTGLTPQTVSPARLQQANALLSLTVSSSALVGPAVAGVLVSAFGSGWAIAVDAATFAVSAAFLTRLTLPRTLERGASRSFVSELAEGWRETTARSWIWVSIVGFMLSQFLVLSTLFVLGPFVSKDAFGGAAAWGLILAGLGAGAIAGDLAALRYRPSRPLLVSQAASLLLAPLMIALAVAPPLVVVTGASVVAGVALSLGNTLWFTALQENVPEHALSRVASFDWMGSMALRPVGYVLAGLVGAAIGPRITLLGAAGLAVATQFVVLSVPGIREFRGRPRPTPGPAVEAENPGYES